MKVWIGNNWLRTESNDRESVNLIFKGSKKEYMP